MSYSFSCLQQLNNYNTAKEFFDNTKDDLFNPYNTGSDFLRSLAMPFIFGFAATVFGAFNLITLPVVFVNEMLKASSVSDGFKAMYLASSFAISSIVISTMSAMLSLVSILTHSVSTLLEINHEENDIYLPQVYQY